jgi:hypothetical protein
LLRFHQEMNALRSPLDKLDRARVEPNSDAVLSFGSGANEKETIRSDVTDDVTWSRTMLHAWQEQLFFLLLFRQQLWVPKMISQMRCVPRTENLVTHRFCELELL